MPNQPTIQSRPERSYVGIRKVMPISDFQREIPVLIGTVIQWLDAHSVSPCGKPFLRYNVVNMPNRLDVELGIPTDEPPAVSGVMRRGALPAGRYAATAYRGVKNGIAANKKLFDWIAEHHEDVASRPSDDGDVFEARYESFLTVASIEPDQDAWETEIAIKLRD